MEAKILAYIQGIAEKQGKKVEKGMDLFAAGILDSLEIISLLNFLQTEFNIKFSPEDLQFENYQTIEKIVGWAEDRIK